MANVKPVPDGYHTVTPYLFIRGAARAIDFYERVFGAREMMRMPGPIGQIMHAEVKIGDSIIMLSDEDPKTGAMSPQTAGGVSTCMHVYLDNVDGVIEKAIDGGARLLRPVKDQFYGDRTGTLLDPFGHMWTVATHVEDVSPEEMHKRAATAMSQSAGA